MPSGRSMCWCTDIVLFQNPPYMTSRHLLTQRILTVGTSFSPLPCQAWHGYGVTSAHRVEVEVGADEPASAPPSWAAAAAPPAGAHWVRIAVVRQWIKDYTLDVESPPNACHVHFPSTRNVGVTPVATNPRRCIRYFATHGAWYAVLFIIIALLRIALPHGEDISLVKHHVTAARHPTSSRIVHQPRR
jgi:hypothetical protein